MFKWSKKEDSELNTSLGLILATFGLISFQIISTQLFSIYQPTRADFLLFPILFLGLAVGYAVSSVDGFENRFGRLLSTTPILLVLFGVVSINTASSNIIIPLIYITFAALGAIQGAAFKKVMLSGKSGEGAYFIDLLGACLGTAFVVLMPYLHIEGSFLFILVTYCFYLWITKPPKIKSPQTWLPLALVAMVVVLPIFFKENFKLLYLMTTDGHPVVVDGGEIQVNGRACVESGDCEHLGSAWDITANVDAIRDLKSKRSFLYYNNERFTEINRDGGEGDFSSVVPLRTPAIEKVLVIGPGGGTEISEAFGSGARQVTAVEINGATIDLMSNLLKNLSNSIYSKAHIVHGDGRSYINKTSSKFDLVRLTYVDLHTTSGASGIFHENYLYTKESFREILNILSSDGVALVKRGVPFTNKPRNEVLRILLAAKEALLESGEDPTKNILVTASSKVDKDYLSHIYIMISKSPLSASFLNRVNVSNVDSHQLHRIFPERDQYNSLLKNHEDLVSKVQQAVETTDLYSKTNSSLLRTPTDSWPFLYAAKQDLIKRLDLLWLAIALLITILVVLYFLKTNQMPDRYGNKRGLILSLWLGFTFGAQSLWLFHLFGIAIGKPIVTMISIGLALLIGSSLGALCIRRLRKRAIGYLMISSIIYLCLIVKIDIMREVSLSPYFVGLLSFLLILPYSFSVSLPFPHLLKHFSSHQGGGALAYLSLNLIGCALGMVVGLYFVFSFSFLHLAVYVLSAHFLVAVWIAFSKTDLFQNEILVSSNKK